MLSDELQFEKDRLLSEGKGSWSRQHYYNFIKASAKWGRHDHANIASDVGKPEAEVAEYAGEIPGGADDGRHQSPSRRPSPGPVRQSS